MMRRWERGDVTPRRAGLWEPLGTNSHFQFAAVSQLNRREASALNSSSVLFSFELLLL